MSAKNIDNIYYRTLKELENKASPGLVNTLAQYMQDMRKNAEPGSHIHTAVEDCTPVLSESPSTLDVVLICYILNGGIVLKSVAADLPPIEQAAKSSKKQEDLLDFDNLFNEALDLLEEDDDKKENVWLTTHVY